MWSSKMPVRPIRGLTEHGVFPRHLQSGAGYRSGTSPWLQAECCGCGGGGDGVAAALTCDAHPWSSKFLHGDRPQLRKQYRHGHRTVEQWMRVQAYPPRKETAILVEAYLADQGLGCRICNPAARCCRWLTDISILRHRLCTVLRLYLEFPLKSHTSRNTPHRAIAEPG